MICRLAILVLLITTTLAPSAPPDPRLAALWDSDHSATIQWYQTQRGCLSVTHASGEQAFIGCYERWPATIIVTLGHAGPLDATARPQAGDGYVVESGGGTYRAPLVGRAQYLAAVRR